MLLEGIHPLYQESDNEELFLRKLRKPKWKFSSRFSDMAKDFFLKLCNPITMERYTSDKALQHPWISRDFGAPIPLTQSQ